MKMSNKIVLPLLLAALFVVASVAATNASEPCDYFVMAVQKCHGDSPFTIHGLWPQYNASKWPSHCSDERFNPADVSNITSELATYWPTCDGGKEDDFLSHEWTKHGTCSGWSQYTYFTTALTVFKNTDWKNTCHSDKDCKVHVYPNNSSFF
eukprot:PhM_4_TR3474/c1_g3_i1/m.77886/K01166/E3.1.27.1; ribonuclease T2